MNTFKTYRVTAAFFNVMEFQEQSGDFQEEIAG